MGGTTTLCLGKIKCIASTHVSPFSRQLAAVMIWYGSTKAPVHVYVSPYRAPVLPRAEVNI